MLTNSFCNSGCHDRITTNSVSESKDKFLGAKRDRRAFNGVHHQSRRIIGHVVKLFTGNFLTLNFNSGVCR